MTLTAAQLARLNLDTTSYQRYEARWWVFPMPTLTIDSTSFTPGQIDPDPIPIVQPRFAVARPGESTLSLDASDSYKWPSKSAYDAVDTYSWAIVSGPGTLVGATNAATATLSLPESDTPTVVSCTVTDGAKSSVAYGRYIRPATPDTGLASTLTLQGTYSAWGWQATLTVRGDLANVVSGDPLQNLLEIEIDRYWDEVRDNFGPYEARPSLMFVGYIEHFEQWERSGEYYTQLQATTSHALMTRYSTDGQYFFYEDATLGTDYFYDSDLRLVDVAWSLLMGITDYTQYFGNVYLWPEPAGPGQGYGRIITEEAPLFLVLADTGSFQAVRPFFTAQNDMIFGPEPCLRTVEYPGGPLAGRGELFDADGAGALTED